MFSVAYVILPFSDTPPADAIRASLARFQGGRRDDVPDGWLEFEDETDDIRRAHEAALTFIELDTGGLRISGGGDCWHIDTAKIRAEMRRLDLRQWQVRFADIMGLDEFANSYCRRLERHPETGALGWWLNRLGRWDWWDLGGRFDGVIVGDQQRREGRSVAAVSSGPSSGRAVLANLESLLTTALGQEPPQLLDVHSDRNIELVATLLEDARAGLEHAFPLSLVMPPGVVEDRLRWLRTWPRLEPMEVFAWLGLPPDASWEAVVTATYARFQDHWAAAIAYHH